MQLRNGLRATLCFAIFSQAVPVLAAPHRNDALKLMQNRGAQQAGPAGVPSILILDNATRTRARAASGGSAEALVFDQSTDSGFGWFVKSDTAHTGTTFAMRMATANGFQPGDSISSYEATFYHSTSDDPSLGDMDVTMELWDGDPASVMETVCTIGGVSAPIPDTAATFSIPYGTVARLRAELPVKVAYDCDILWAAMQIDTGCRGAWRMSGTPLVDTFDVRPAIGESNGIWMAYPCEAFSACPTDTGRNSGFCCGSPAEPCNHATDPGTPCSSEAAQAATFCGDGVTDYEIADIGIEGAEESYVASLFAATETTMSVVPVSVDVPPPGTGAGAGVISLGGDEVVLQSGGHNVWLEIRIGDWDPHDLPDDDPAGKLAGYQPAINAVAGFSSGLQGQLAPFFGPSCGECIDNQAACHRDAECTSGRCSGTGDLCTVASVLVDCPYGETCDGAAACVGTEGGNDLCAAEVGVGSRCSPLGYFIGSGACAWTYTDSSRPDWALRDAGATLAGLDLCCTDARPSYAVVFGPPNDPVPFPAEGMYASTMAVAVPSDAKGTFTIGLKPFPFSVLDSGAGPPIPLLGIIPGKITVQTGRCCITLPEGGAACIDTIQTAESCAQIGGDTMFTANEACPENGGPPCACDPNVPGTFDDLNACTEDACIDFLQVHTPKTCPIGDRCFDYGCDPDDATGVGCFATPRDVDDGLACTVDNCSGSIETHTPVGVGDGDECTVDYCEEPRGYIFHDDISTVPNDYPCPTGDPVADGCPGTENPRVFTTCTDGYCHCIGCSSEITCPAPECFTPDPPLPDLVANVSGTLQLSAKNRFLSFGDAYDICGELKAARVTFVSLPVPLDVWEGHQLWVTNPVEVNQNGGTVPPVEGSPSFYAATLSCDGPTYANYACMETVHVFHEGIVPSGTYEIELLSEFCSPDFPGDFSPPLEITTALWGDVLGERSTTPASAPDGNVQISDLLGILSRFSSVPGSIGKARADLEPACLDLRVNVSDALAGLEGFRRFPYTFPPSASDPCASTCSNPLP